jgi:hypothetical protein
MIKPLCRGDNEILNFYETKEVKKHRGEVFWGFAKTQVSEKHITTSPKSYVKI